jgi:hypothetical protein
MTIKFSLKFEFTLSPRLAQQLAALGILILRLMGFL